MIGVVPAYYVVASTYSAMTVASVICWRTRLGLFLFRAIPVIALALVGTFAEVSGVPTCPRSAGELRCATRSLHSIPAFC